MEHQLSTHACAGQFGDSVGGGQNANSLCERQRYFAATLLNPTMPVPYGLVGPDGKRSEKRFNVYRNNVVAGLIEALRAAFPAVCRIVGDEFFAAMARVYVASEPTGSPIMLHYGATFPSFIRTFEPAKSVPYLCDVARLERAWAEAYHAAEASSVDAAMLATLDSRSLPQVRFTLHPSIRLVRSPFPAVHLWLMNIDGGVPTATDLFGGGENALVVRPVAEVEVRQVPDGAAIFIQALATGATMGDATAFGLDEDSGFDLAGTLRDLFAINAIVGWHLQDVSDSMPIKRFA